MVTIKEAELLTGITRQNIRYYEKMGLIHPSREKENQYRKYNKDDIRRLKLIYMFRKLDMPLEEIQQILDGRKDLQEALEQQKEQLRQKQQKLAAALSFCGEIQETELTDLNVDLYLQKMEAEEKQGNKFADILDDYKKVVESESIRTFSFSPDDFCTTPRQMTEQLFRYAQRNHLDLVITKGRLMPGIYNRWKRIPCVSYLWAIRNGHSGRTDASRKLCSGGDVLEALQDIAKIFSDTDSSMSALDDHASDDTANKRRQPSGSYCFCLGHTGNACVYYLFCNLI